MTSSQSILGNHLGQYEVVSKIGEGGMGEVYRARDKDLGRDVAIKVLPAGISSDPDRLRRFEQEARAAGSLNHPNILVIFHVGTHENAPYIVSELLDGETLRDRMAGKALPPRKAMDFALQTAQGLAAAHEKGIVHRDLKPENVFITKDGRVKILDFGLAKLTQPESGMAQTDIPTRRVDTDPGTIMGTVGYMSPEQVRGRLVDHRSDIFSFGAILYEMLSGRRAFHGESTADTISAILREDPPDLTQTNKSVAPALERVINHCLEKNPEERFHSARDLAFALQALSGSTSLSDPTMIGGALPRPRRRYREVIAWSLAAIFLLAGAVMAALYFTKAASDERPTRFVVAMPDKATEIVTPVISPDGRSIAFVATVEGKRALYVRAMDLLESHRLNGTDDANFPFWSPDSRYIGFFSQGKLRKIDAAGGPAQTLCDARTPTGGTWNRDGVILFGSIATKSLQRVSAAGGEPIAVTSLDETRNESEHWHPSFLPDGKNFLYYAWNGNINDTAIYVAAIDGSERKILLKNDSNVAYVAPGYLLFARGSTVTAQPFELSTLALKGEPSPVLENVTYTPNNGYSHFSVSENGVLTYLSGGGSARQLVWVDRQGKQIATVGGPEYYNDVVLSPDEKRAALQKIEGNNASGDLWLIDLVKGVPSRFTFAATSEDDPAWSADGGTIIYTVNGEGKDGIYRKNSSGAGNEELISRIENFGGDGIDLSRDGKYVIFPKAGVGVGMDLWILPLDAPSQPYAFINSEFNEYQGRFSPDGRWIAYVSNESGRPEVYVRTFPDASGKWQISSGGAGQPLWRLDGKELFYIAADRKLMAVEVKQGGGFETSSPSTLFQTLVTSHTLPNRYAASADGQRFLINSQVEESSRTPITVVMNWGATLKK